MITEHIFSDPLPKTRAIKVWMSHRDCPGIGIERFAPSLHFLYASIARQEVDNTDVNNLANILKAMLVCQHG